MDKNKGAAKELSPPTDFHSKTEYLEMFFVKKTPKQLS